MHGDERREHANDGLRFVVELDALAAVGCWGMRAEGLEPPRPLGHEHLKLARMPNFATPA
jgi:hypothetical protein